MAEIVSIVMGVKALLGMAKKKYDKNKALQKMAEVEAAYQAMDKRTKAARDLRDKLMVTSALINANCAPSALGENLQALLDAVNAVAEMAGS